MANDYFKFKHFIVHQQRCAMKVGTDGTLLGAWANAPENACRILDIGTGTGLIALMMAQRFPKANVLGIDIDPEAVAQATENVLNSPFSERIVVRHVDITQFEDSDGFEAIVCNPPYFENALTCPDVQRTTARHMVNLSYKALIQSVCKLLKRDGFFSVVIPSDCRQELESCARLEGLFPSRICKVRTTPKKEPKRQLIEFGKLAVNKLNISEEILESSLNVRSIWYQQLTNDFYIK